MNLNISFRFCFCDCCRKTTVCNRDQLLDFSVPELIPSPEVLQKCAALTLRSSAALAVGECSAVLTLTPCMLRVQIYCVLRVLDYYLVEFSNVSTGLGWPMLNLCV